jgi:hypothetical protein
MDVTGCPEPGCSLPAEILDRRVLESTDGPIEHARILCLSGHRFLMPIEMLPQGEDVRIPRRSAMTAGEPARRNQARRNEA